MEVTVNLKVTDDELRKYAADVGRRWILDAIHAVIQHAPALKPPPGFIEGIFQAIAMRESKPSPSQSSSGIAAANTNEPPKKCGRLEGDPMLDDGWICHCCATYNGLHRSACRGCKHERCDVVITPPPVQRPAIDPDESDWRCGNCAVCNALHRPTCRSCGYAQGAPPPPGASSDVSSA